MQKRVNLRLSSDFSNFLLGFLSGLFAYFLTLQLVFLNNPMDSATIFALRSSSKIYYFVTVVSFLVIFGFYALIRRLSKR